MNARSWMPVLWPTTVLVTGGAAMGLVAADVEHPARSLIVLWFLLVCPGILIVRRIRVIDTVALVPAAVAVSTSLEIALSLLMVYGGWWDPELLLAGLVAATSVWSTVELVLRRPHGATVAEVRSR